MIISIKQATSATASRFRSPLNYAIAPLFALVVVLCSPSAMAAAKALAPEKIEGTITINAEQLIEMASNIANLVIIDSRKSSDWDRGHIDGTVHLVNTEMAPNKLAAIVSRDQPVVFYCNGPKCTRSGDASTKAVSWGWKKIYWFRGGTEEWTSKGFPLTN